MRTSFSSQGIPESFRSFPYVSDYCFNKADILVIPRGHEGDIGMECVKFMEER